MGHPVLVLSRAANFSQRGSVKHRNHSTSWKEKWAGFTSTFRITVLIGYYDYHPVTKLPKIGSCDYSQMSF